jgi:uncharacterized membrane protein
LLALVLSIVSAASWGVSDFLGGLQSRRLPVLAVLAVSQPAGLLLIAVLILFLGADPVSADNLAVAFFAGAAALAGLGAFYAAMAMGTVSVVAPIASLVSSCRSRSGSPRARARPSARRARRRDRRSRGTDL